MVSSTLGGRYKVLKHLGGGGFGQTYLAADQHLPGHPQCVVKQLKPQKAEGVSSLESARRLFDAEAKALYQLGTHPCIPRLLAHFEEGEQFYLVQEYVSGPLLGQILQDQAPMAEGPVVDMLLDVLETLAFVHEHQVIHRDIKPSNLIQRDDDNRIVLIDFGSVKQVSSLPVEVDGHISITIAVGSMGYMPNEQLAGQPCLSSDIYAVGMLALQALTGVDPRRFRKDPRTSEIIWQDLVLVSEPLAAFIDRMIRYDYRQRFASATEALMMLRDTVTPMRPLQAAEAVLLEQGLQEVHLSWLERADELFQQSRYSEAVVAYSRFLQVQASHEQAWFKLGLAYENLGNIVAALDAYSHVLKLRPHDYLAWLKQARALETLGQLEEALAAYDEAVHLQPDHYWAWSDRGSVQQQLNRQEDAIASFDHALQIKPDFQHARQCRKASLQSLQRLEDLYQLEHYDEAVAVCQQTLQEHPQDSTAWLMQAMALENLDRLKDAAIAYDRVLRLQPDDHVAWFRLAEVLERLNRYRQAALAYSQVLRIQPTNHWAWFQRGQMLIRLGRLEKAMASFNQAIQLKPSFRPALTARQGLIEQLLNRPGPASRQETRV